MAADLCPTLVMRLTSQHRAIYCYLLLSAWIFVLLGGMYKYIGSEDGSGSLVRHSTGDFTTRSFSQSIRPDIKARRVMKVCNPPNMITAGSEANDEALCSHIRSVCYMAETLTPYSRMAVPCARRCAIVDRSSQFFDRHAPPVPMGHGTPNSASGTFCVVNKDAPYCPSSKHPIGSPLCCVPPKMPNDIPT